MRHLAWLVIPFLFGGCSLFEPQVEVTEAVPAPPAEEKLLPAGPAVEVIAKGRIEGLPWRLETYRSNEGFCVDLRVQSNSSGGCGFGPPVGEHLTVSGFGWSEQLPDLAQLRGRVSPRVAKLTIRLENETRTLAVYESERFGGLHFVAFVPFDQPAVLVALDERGDVLKRRPLRSKEHEPSLL